MFCPVKPETTLFPALDAVEKAILPIMTPSMKLALPLLAALWNIFPMDTVFAQDALITGGIPGCNNFSGPMEAVCVPNFLAHAIKFFFSITGTFCILMIIISGYEYILGTIPGGNLGSKESAVQRLTWAIVGFIISALSFFIIDFVIAAIAGTVNVGG